MSQAIDSLTGGNDPSPLVRDGLLALVMMECDGVRKDDAAELLGIPENTLGTRKHRVLRQLRSQFTRETLSA